MARRIAIVEDEAAIRANYADAFQREGYTVDAYEARNEALQAFDVRLPDLVVIDINLKDDVEGGFELCRELQLFSGVLVAIDGSKFKAANTRDKNYSKAKMKRRLRQIEESIERYLGQMESADRVDPGAGRRPEPFVASRQVRVTPGGASRTRRRTARRRGGRPRP